ncbi:HAD-IIB family hydrolase [Thalassotalea castellviae]|uniref:HAD-IIB family hydrolase n=1 Tax=Thalassotalea castellviae TaxID=3075612 RepID=A0ABU3A4D1_9GAMM|nr:HAD-IIB family hydrolase [Thalassotalea sp. W431]MDT0605034.1 HAD-IIB family hydrolase [Thalassotalea sp. W431]
MRTEKVLIFSDLDGTLLDHYTYQANDAYDTIFKLKKADIPIILNTSKTRAELANIQAELALDTPFIIENGAAVFIPKTTFSTQPADTSSVDNYWVKSFASSRKYWLELLDTVCGDFKHLYQGFSTLTVEQLTKLTGLSADKAAQAKQRQYGEPIHWLGDEKSKQLFIEQLVDYGANVVQGGRFLHLSGYCDKGQALIWLTEQYREHYNQENIYTIALGDGENDIAMLEAAEVAVQIRSPVHDFPTLYRQNRHTIQTELCGPSGWAEAIQALLFSSSNSQLPKKG